MHTSYKNTNRKLWQQMSMAFLSTRSSTHVTMVLRHFTAITAYKIHHATASSCFLKVEDLIVTIFSLVHHSLIFRI